MNCDLKFVRNAVLAGLLAMTAGSVCAGTSAELESSAIVKGTIVLAKDGSVQSTSIDDESKVGQPIVDLVKKAASQWRFQPVMVEGEPVVAKSSMNVRLVATKMPSGDFSVFVKGATFGEGDDQSATDTLRRSEGNKRMLPRYPEAAIRGHMQGTVYLALRVDGSGQVAEVAVEQVNLESIGPENLLNQWRAVFATAAVKTAKKWTFIVPTTGKLAKRESWTARVPVGFTINDLGAPKTETIWRTYIPGPYSPAPWLDKPDGHSADALADGAIQTEGAGLVLLSPLNQG